MKQEVRLEQIEHKDCEAVRNLMVKVYEDEMDKWFRTGGHLSIPGYDSVAMQEYHTWDNHYYKILYEDMLVGVVLLTYTGREHARIDRLYILPEYQGLGIGSQVLHTIEAMFPEVNEWSLDTIQQSPRNHHFYEKNGYVLMGEDEDERYYVKVKGQTYDTKEDYHCNMDFEMHNFRGCNMSNVDLYDCNMCNAKFSNMNLQSNLYTNSNLSNTRFTNVDLSHCVIGDSNIEGMIINGVKVEDLLQLWAKQCVL